jgi:hypothetical protein
MSIAGLLAVQSIASRGAIPLLSTRREIGVRESGVGLWSTLAFATISLLDLDGGEGSGRWCVDDGG